jgi:hypothetical protein
MKDTLNRASNQTYFCYVVDRVVNTNPYLFDSDGNSKDVNKNGSLNRYIQCVCQRNLLTSKHLKKRKLF